ncbi:MAG: diacylglycerol kinase family protein [Ilumatobacter sp.]
MRSVRVLGDLTDDVRRAQLDAVAHAVRARGADASSSGGTSPEDARAAAEAAVADGCDRLIAVGGDGVVHLAINAVATTATVLGLVPIGTGNDFARALGLLDGDGDVDTHVDRALSDGVPVDGIRTDHGWVATVATLGFSGDVTARANSLRWPTGSQRYTVATLLQLPRLRAIDATVKVDGMNVGADTSLLSVGNTSWFGGGMKICPDARPDDGLLHVVNIAAVSRRRFVRVFPTVFSGRHVRRDDVTTASGTVATIDGPSEIELWADGELLGPLPVRLELIPGAVQVAGAVLR